MYVIYSIVCNVILGGVARGAPYCFTSILVSITQTGAAMESSVEANPNTDDVIYEMMEQPAFNREQHQDRLPPKTKHTEDKWPLCIVMCLLMVILLVLIILVGMCGFIISQASPTECTSTTATTASILNADATAINVSRLAERISQVLLEVRDLKATFNNSLGILVEEIRNRIDNMEEEIINKTTRISEKNNSTARCSKNLEKLKNLIEITDSDLKATFNDSLGVLIGEILNRIEDMEEEILDKTTRISEKNNSTASKNLEILKNLIEITDRKVDAIQNTSTSNAAVINDVLLMTKRLLALHNFSLALPTSCKEIEQEQLSGIYELASFNETYEAYCNMEELCGSEGGWTRLAYLNMSDFSETCPSGFRLYQSGDVRACGRPATSSAGCVSVQFPSNGISYSQVCGRVTGYQYGTPDAVHSGFTPNHYNLNGDYVDGVSITRGSPRKHVWTLIAGYTDQTNSNNIYFNCPCSTGSTQHIQSFVGNHYTCESGNPTNPISLISPHLYTADPLWDGQGCSSYETACCDIPDIPWFHRDYGSTTTTDYIELRVCGDEGTDNEDTPISYYEIYVK